MFSGWMQECHLASAARKEREMNAGAQIFLLFVQSHGMGPPHPGESSLLNLYRNSFIATPQVSFHGDYESC